MSHQAEGSRAEQNPFFEHSATLRIFGSIPSLEELTARLGLTPTHAHRCNEWNASTRSFFENDMWQFTAPIPRASAMDAHISSLWSHRRDRVDEIHLLKEQLTVDLFCTYLSDCSTAGLSLSSESVSIMSALGVPFELSIIVL
jgi:hypothetical protein